MLKILRSLKIKEKQKSSLISKETFNKEVNQQRVTLPAPQRTLENCFYLIVVGFGIEKCRVIFGVNFQRRFQGKKAPAVLKNFRENSEQNSVRNLGTNFQEFGALPFCNFSDLRKRCAEGG